jgi:hypothetical protein
VFTRRHPSPARWLGGALRRHGDAVFEYAHFLTRDEVAARALQRAAFLDAHQALLLGGRLKHPRRWLLRAVRDTAEATRPADEELAVLRRTCGLRWADAEWVLGVDAERVGRLGRRARVAVGAGAGAAMAARTSTAKALAAQIPGFTAASATGATHLIVASAVASSALVGTAAVTTRLELHPHHATPAHSTPNPRPANPTSDRSGPVTSGPATGGAQGAADPGAGQTMGDRSGQGTGQGTGQPTGTGQGAKGQGTSQGTPNDGTGASSGQGSTNRTTPAPTPTSTPAPPTGGNPVTQPAPRHPTGASGSGSSHG